MKLIHINDLDINFILIVKS